MPQDNRRFKLAELVAAIVESSEDAIFLTAADGIIQSWNEGARRLFGYAAPEVVGNNAVVLLRPGREAALEGFLKSVRSGRTIRDVEAPFVRKDGSLVQARISVSPLSDAAGEVVAFLTILRDLSERNRQQAELHAREVSYQKLVETAHEGIWTVDSEDHTTFVNQRQVAQRLLSQRDGAARTRPASRTVPGGDQGNPGGHLPPQDG